MEALASETIANKRMPDRKVIVCTNAAETSLTIDGVTVVVDTLLVNEVVEDPRNGTLLLYEVLCAKASADQRAGRAGRTQPGKVFRMASQALYQMALPGHKAPDVMRQNMSSTTLTLMN